MKRVLFVMLAMLVAVSMAVISCAPAGKAGKTVTKTVTATPAKGKYGPPEKVTQWTFQPCFGPGDAGWDLGVVPWVNMVEKATKGTVKIKLVPAGTITSGGEAFSATSEGTIDVYAGWATVYGGEMPEGMLAYGQAMTTRNWEEQWDLMWGDPKYRVGELVEKAAHQRNLHWAGWSDQGPNAAFTNFEVHKWEDFQGKKMRAGGPQARFFKAMGGKPVSMGAGDIYMAIKLGEIEGTFWDTGGIDDMKFTEVVDYAILPGWTSAQHQEIYVNLDSWKALNQWQRDQIDDIFMPHYFLTSRLHNEGVMKALEDLKDHGGKVIRLSDKEVERMKQRVKEKVWPATAELSPLAKKGMEKYKEFLKDRAARP